MRVFCENCKSSIALFRVSTLSHSSSLCPMCTYKFLQDTTYPVQVETLSGDKVRINKLCGYENVCELCLRERAEFEYIREWRKANVCSLCLSRLVYNYIRINSHTVLVYPK